MVVFALVGVAVALFVTERIPNHTTAITVVVSLVVLQPWTHITAEEAISGFSNAATITIVAMCILSAGVERTGGIGQLEVLIARYTAGSRERLLANLITPVASVALVMSIAVSAARSVGADAFAFALAVTFAASTAFMAPMGYQTNLMVYSPGGYRFTDFVRVGAPLQLLLAVVTTLRIAAIWGV